jgi:hypothetical protein
VGIKVDLTHAAVSEPERFKQQCVQQLNMIAIKLDQLCDVKAKLGNSRQSSLHQ